MATNVSNQSIFNPDVSPVPDKSWLGLSKEISTPRPYSAEAEIIKGVTAVGTDVVKVAHTLTQQHLDDEIYAKIDSVRDPYKAQLEATYKAATAGNPTAATNFRVDVNGNPIGGPASLLAGKEAAGEPPEALGDLTENLTTLKGARANGTLSRTDYLMRLDATAKQFRTDFPGWREHIDQKYKEILGEDPANAGIRARIADINSFTQNANKFHEKVLTQAFQHIGQPGIEKAIVLYKAGHLSDSAMLGILADASKLKAQADETHYRWSITDNDQKTRASLGNEIATNIVRSEVGADLNLMLHASGFSTNPREAMEQMKRIAAEDPKKAAALAQQMAINEATLRAQIIKKLNEPFQGGPSLAALMTAKDPKSVNALVDEHLAVHKTFRELMAKGETDLATYTARVSKALGDAKEAEMLGSPKLGDKLLEIGVIDKYLKNNPVVLQTVIGDFSSTYGLWSANKAAERMAGTVDPLTGKTHTVLEDIEEINRRIRLDPKVPEESKAKMIGEAVERTLGQIDYIGDPTHPLELRQRYVKDTFSPEVQGLIARSEAGDARTRLFTRLIDQKKTDQIYAMGGEYWQMYTNWTRSTLTAEYLKPEITALNKYLNNPNLKFSYDDKTHAFSVDIGPTSKEQSLFSPGESFSGSSGRNKWAAAQAFTTNLNSVMSKYAYLAKKEGQDPNAEIFRAIQGAGGRLTREMLEAMAASQTPPKPASAAPDKRPAVSRSIKPTIVIRDSGANLEE